MAPPRPPVTDKPSKVKLAWDYAWKTVGVLATLAGLLAIKDLVDTSVSVSPGDVSEGKIFLAPFALTNTGKLELKTISVDCELSNLTTEGNVQIDKVTAYDYMTPITYLTPGDHASVFCKPQNMIVFKPDARFLGGYITLQGKYHISLFPFWELSFVQKFSLLRQPDGSAKWIYYNPDVSPDLEK